MRHMFAIIGLACFAIAADSAPKPAWTTLANVTRVIDGDTLEVEVRRTFRVRLLECWAPESRRDPRLEQSLRSTEKLKGQVAKENLISLANGREVIVSVPVGDDGDVSRIWTMGRVLGNVWLTSDPEQSLSEKQVEAGFATKEKPEELK